MVRRRRSFDERFWSKVDFGGVCWEWIGAITGAGYGNFTVQKGRFAAAHRVAWSALVGPIQPGLTLDHLCRNRACVNPDHLEPVTFRENLRRGSGWAGRNARKTHCVNGHPFDRANTIVDSRGRVCRACRDEKNRNTTERRRRERHAAAETVS